MLMLKTIILLQIFIISKKVGTNKVLATNKASGIEGNDKLIKKLVGSKIRKLSKLEKLSRT